METEGILMASGIQKSELAGGSSFRFDLWKVTLVFSHTLGATCVSEKIISYFLFSCTDLFGEFEQLLSGDTSSLMSWEDWTTSVAAWETNIH